MWKYFSVRFGTIQTEKTWIRILFLRYHTIKLACGEKKKKLNKVIAHPKPKKAIQKVCAWRWFYRIVVSTSALHVEGPEFEPQ